MNLPAEILCAFDNLSIKHKLTILVAATGAAVVALACASFLTYEVHSLRRRMSRSVVMEGRIIGDNTTAALAFNDPETAAKTLASLSEAPHVLGARLYTKDGRPFADYRRASFTGELPASPSPDEVRFERDRLTATVGVFLRRERIGTLVLWEDLGELRQAIAYFLAIAALILLACSGAAIGLGTLFQRKISVPILELARAAKQITERSDYSVCVIKRSEDELGVLADCFNEMLRRIESRAAALRASEKRLKDMMDYSPAAIFTKSLEGRYLFANKHYAKLTGRRLEQIVGLTTEELWPKETAWPLIEHDRKVLATGGPMTFEEQLAGHDGPQTFLSVKFVLRDVSGTPYAICGIAVDITGRKRGESERQRAVSLLQATLESTADGILVVDNAGQIASYNANFVRMWRVPEEILASHDDQRALASVLDQLRHPSAFLDKVRELYASPLSESFDVLEFKDGRVFERFSKAQVIGNEAVGRVWSFRDVTDRRKTEGKLEHALSLLRSTLESTYDGILVVDNKRRITSYNRRFAQMWNVPEEILASGDDDRVLSCALDLLKRPDSFIAKISELYASEAKSFDVFEMKDGRIIERYSEPQRLGSETVGRVWNFRDVTDRRRAEEEVRRLNADLERRVADRTAQLRAVNEELESFSYSTSHDLRAPLRSIDGFSTIMLQDLRLDAKAQEFLQRIRKATRRMSDIIDDMLDLSRVTRREIRHETVDLSALARGILAGLQRADPGRKAAVDIKPGLQACGDASLLHLMLENLLSNAWKYTSKTPQARIELGMETKDGRKVYHVRDNGVGFDPAYAGRLFQPFVRLHSSEEFPGTGVGLTIVSRILARHGGKIWAVGAVGKGATFYFTLPEHQRCEPAT